MGFRDPADECQDKISIPRFVERRRRGTFWLAVSVRASEVTLWRQQPNVLPRVYGII